MSYKYVCVTVHVHVHVTCNRFTLIVDNSELGKFIVHELLHGQR